jgi:uncharacterized RDD family membrane protein YckC
MPSSLPVSHTVPVTPFITGEAVVLETRLAGLGSRALARFIDLGIQALGYLLLWAVVSMSDVGSGSPAASETMAIVLSVIVLAVYPILSETVARGRTVGKMIVGLRVVRDDGGPITFRHALVRGLVGLAIDFPGLALFPITWLAAIWSMVISSRSKRIGDHFAGTIVIHERTPAAWVLPASMPPELAEWGSRLDLTALDDGLGLAVRQYLVRHRTLREPFRTRLGDALAAEVAALVTPPPPPGTPTVRYLAAVHAQRQRRTQTQLAATRGRAASVWPDPPSVTAGRRP